MLPVPATHSAAGDMYAQWQMWFSKEFINTVFKSRNGKYQGIKLGIFSYFAASSGGNKLVVQTLGGRQIPFLHQYDNTGATRNLQVGLRDGADFDWQPKEGVAPSCLYTRVNNTPFEVGRNVGAYEAGWFVPYMTGGSTGHPMCTVRMREVIVDVNPIPSPSLIQVPSSSRRNQTALPRSVGKSRATDRH